MRKHLAVFAIALLALTGCSQGQDADGATAAAPTPEQTEATGTYSPNASLEREAAAEQGTQAADTAVAEAGTGVEDEGYTISSIDCSSYGDGDYEFTTLKEAWTKSRAVDEDLYCDVRVGVADYDDPLVDKAMRTAYGSDVPQGGLEMLLALCTEPTIAEGIDELKHMQGALMLCPDHPSAKAFKKTLPAFKSKDAKEQAEFAAAEAEEAAIEVDKENGKYVVDGSYLVGSEVKPGLWQSQGERVTECYWEVSDAEGNILSNNFINVAPQFKIRVPASASGLTVRGCEFRWTGK